jgi:hypothetical protein
MLSSPRGLDKIRSLDVALDRRRVAVDLPEGEIAP